MTGGMWALVLLAVVVLGFLYFLRTPRKLQTLGDPNNRSMIRIEEDRYEAVPLVDQAEQPGGPYERATRSVKAVMAKEHALPDRKNDQAPPDT